MAQFDSYQSDPEHLGDDDPEIVEGMRRLAQLRELDAAGPAGLDTDDMSDLPPLTPTSDEQ